jgi:hypothetical protein
MPFTLLPSTRHPFRGIGAALLWGVVELVALARSRRAVRLRHGR